MSNATNSSIENPIILVDGSSYLFRAYHSPPHLTNSKGEATGAIYGVVNMLKSLVRQYSPSKMVVVFDAKGPTFRNEMYSEYKANRPPMPDDLRTQIEPIHKIIKAMGLPLIAIEGVEADDVIGTLAQQQSDIGNHVLISTGDKDMAQLVNDKVTLINTMTNTILNPQGVVDKFGVGPELIIDYLALMGDKVDNIPGVPGVGEKTAVALLQGLGSIENIYSQLDDVAALGFRGSKTMSKKLEDNKEQLTLSYQLATIKLDVEHGIENDQMFVQSPNLTELAELYKECEFKRWLAEVLAPKGNEQAPPLGTTEKPDETTEPEAPSIDRSNYQTIYTIEAWQRVLCQLQTAKIIAFDTETTSLDYMEAQLVGFSIAWQTGQSNAAIYVPLAHDYEDAPAQLSLDDVKNDLVTLLTATNISVVGQNLKYDKNVLAKYGIEITNVGSDTMLQSYIFNSTATRHDMDNLALKYLGHKCISFEDIAGKGAKQITFNKILIDEAAPYAAEDADITLRLYEYFQTQLSDIPSLNKILNEIELPLVDVLSKIEQTGVLIDADQLHNLSAEFAGKLQELESRAHELAGESFNLASPKQLQKILFEKLELPVVKKTPKGAPSTAEAVLQALALAYELPRVLSEFRGLCK